MSEYDFVATGSLKLKGVAGDSGIKKKKKKSKDKKKELEKAVEAVEGHNEASTSKGSEDIEHYYAGKTKAEIAFLKKKEIRDQERIKEKAKSSHKERVEKFNEYLNSLSEHYEPAKVSWTK